MKLAGKTAFITGGNSGLGLATAKLFIAEGAKVAITGRNQETLDQAREALGPNLLAIKADLSDVKEIERAVSEAVAVFGKLDIVFANAGVAALTPVGSTTLETFQNIIQTNLTGTFFTVQAAEPHLNPGASIILNGSVHATMGWPGYSAYAATKGAVRSMTRVMAAEFAPRGIRVNQITPGAARTPVWNPLASTSAEMDALEQKLTTTIPTGRIGEAEEVATVALFLASSDSANVVGAEIVVDGGATGAPLGAPAHRKNWDA